MMTFLEYMKNVSVDLIGRPIDVQVHTNPSKSEFDTLLGRSKYNEIRGFVDDRDNVHVWRSEDGTHERVMQGMGSPLGTNAMKFYARRNGVEAFSLPHIKKLYDHPKVKRMYGGEIPTYD